MKNIVVVYWSGTGNTEAMAQCLADAADTEAIEVSAFSADNIDDYEAFAFGCPAMGAEELDEEFEEVWDECVSALASKPVILFGSYDWGTGEWMETWKEQAEAAGVDVVETVIAHLEPEDEDFDNLKEALKKLD